MEIKSKVVILALMVVAASAMSVKAKASDDGICGLSQSELMECKPAVAAGASPSKPTGACCASLKHADLPCFCSFKNNKSLPFLGINVTRAMQLPTTCDPTQTVACA